ncbi:family 10 glycosylhydrolase [Gimesia panareensis]|uniref:Uncharacterized protein n=1 Tax=Gimesia panareensis TaxID=2527978 RepID=A0A518A757_9PLAN|nr:family 10 glycosylhydrolase [Gimesia panareensis]QDT26572.1 hypothetical protein Enr10x_18760 [Gimesia panareensis]QDU50549.1 hypothetical protein Pan110_29010 [Gimesia panareensis]
MTYIRKRIWILSGIFCLLACPALADEGTAVATRIRIEWGEQTPRLWNARFKMTGGRIETARSLGVDADEIAVIARKQDQVLYQPRASRVFNSIEFEVRGNLTAKLQVYLQDSNDSSITMQHEFLLRELLQQKAILPVSQTNAQLIVQQAPGEMLSIHVDRPHLIYEPEETVSLTVFPHFLHVSEIAPGESLSWVLARARNSEPVEKGKVQLAQTSRVELLKAGAPVSFKAPQEGVYNLRVQTTSGYTSMVQFVVLDRAARKTLVESGEGTPLLVDSLTLNGIQNQNDLVARRARGRIRNSFRSLFKSGRETLPESASTLPWSAWHLKISHPQQPHRLVITYPAAMDTHLGFSLLEPDAAGQLVPVGVDGGVYQPASPSAINPQESGAESKVELLFWPKVNNPILLFHSLGRPDAAEVAEVKVYELAVSTEDVSAELPATVEKKRLVGPYLQKPLLPEIFGATQILDPSSHRSLDDWQTFYDAGERLAQYLQYQRFNSVLLGVAADGSAIYPSETLDPTPRYDSGVYHSSGQDIQRKDVLEMLFRIFDREQLTLVPELQFSSMISALEKLIQEQSEEAIGIELVNFHGQTWRKSQVAARGQAPFYNPLNPRVQAEIVKVFSELVDRYQKHSSFQGVAVQLSLNGYLQLPGLDWGYDDATVNAFTRETGVRIPRFAESHKYEKRYQYLTTTALPQWTEWRCQKIRTLHEQLAGVLSRAKPEAQLIFSARELIPTHSRQGNVITALKTGAPFRPILMEMGLDFSRYDQISNGIVVRPERFTWGPQAERDLQFLNTHSTIDDSFKSRVNGVVFYHQPLEIRIPEFDRISPWQPAFTWLATQASPSAESNQIRYVHAVAALDPYVTFDGGWTIPFGQEQTTRSIRSQLIKLPARPFQTIESSQQPVITRFSRGKEKSVYYLVNDFPYSCQATVKLVMPAKATLTSLETGETVKVTRSASDECSYMIQLGAYDLQAFEVDDATQTRLLSVKTSVEQGDLKELQARIDQKKKMLVQLHRSQDDSSAVVFRADFESKNSRDYILAGWESKVEQGVAWNLDKTEAHSGRTSLVLDTQPGNNFLRTNPIPLQDCRYLNMGVWMKSRSPNMQVRISLEAEQNGKLKVQSAIIAVDQNWRKYVFRVKDIPSDQIQNAQIVIEKLGAEKLWIDDVDLQIHQISPEDDRQLTKLISTLALAWDSQRYLDCYHLLESYWGQFGEQITPHQSREDSPTSQPVKHVERRGLRKLIQR